MEGGKFHPHSNKPHLNIQSDEEPKKEDSINLSDAEKLKRQKESS